MVEIDEVDTAQKSALVQGDIFPALGTSRGMRANRTRPSGS